MEVLKYGVPQEDEERDQPLKLAVLISNKGTGSNLQAVIDAIDRGEINCKVGLVISDREGAKGLDRAKNHAIPYVVKELKIRKDPIKREEYGSELADDLNKDGIQVAVLAGFGTILAPTYFEKFNGISLNIHPGMIPDKKDEPVKFPDQTDAPWNQGMMTEKAVENFLGMRYAGSSIHIATPEADFGPVLKRVVIPVEPSDDVDSLYGRLKQEEHKGMIAVLKDLSTKKQ